MNNYIFIGSTGEKINKIGGAIEKNYNLIKFLKKDSEVEVIDTSNWENEKVKIFIEIIKVIMRKKNEKIILSISNNSANKILKIIYMLNIFKKEVFYFVIGGKLADRIESNFYKIKFYKNIKSIFVESKSMRDKMLSLKLNQCEYLPNFKEFKIRKLPLIKEKKILKCVFLSRIIPEKGVNMIFDMLKFFSSEIEVDFYGPIDIKYEKEFFKKIKQEKKAEYKGILNMKKESAYDILESYDLMLFPTFWDNEGFPGVIIDSFIASLPVLASDWNYNSEIIQEGRTGFLFKAKDQNDFNEKMKYILNNKKILLELRKNCNKECKKYHINNVLKDLSLR